MSTKKGNFIPLDKGIEELVASVKKQLQLKTMPDKIYIKIKTGNLDYDNLPDEEKKHLNIWIWKLGVKEAMPLFTDAELIEGDIKILNKYNEQIKDYTDQFVEQLRKYVEYDSNKAMKTPISIIWV